MSSEKVLKKAGMLPERGVVVGWMVAGTHHLNNGEEEAVTVSLIDIIFSLSLCERGRGELEPRQKKGHSPQRIAGVAGFVLWNEELEKGTLSTWSHVRSSDF